MYISHYVNKYYDIDKNPEINEDPLPKKWSGMGHRIAYIIHNSTDVVIISLISILENVSIYAVYNMVVGALKMLLSSFTTGFQFFFAAYLLTKKLNC